MSAPLAEPFQAGIADGSPASRWPRLLGRALYWSIAGLLYFAVSSAVLDSFHDHWAMGDKWRKSRFNRAIHYKVPPPFVYRVLTPWLVNTIAERVPPAAHQALAATGQRLRQRYALRDENDSEYAIAHYLIFVSLLGTLLAWRSNLTALGLGPPAFRDFTPPLALTLLPMTFMRGGFIYDAPELLLTALALTFFLRRRWIPFYLTFALAVLNKESDILLPVWFLAAFLCHRDWRFLLRHAAISVATGAPIFLAVKLHFADRPVDPFKLLLRGNLQYLATPSTYWSGFDIYAEAIPAPEGFHLFNLFVLTALLVLTWRLPELREVWLICVGTGLALLPFFLLFGYRDEIRVFGPAYAALVLLAAAWVHRLAAGSSGAATTPVTP